MMSRSGSQPRPALLRCRSAPFTCGKAGRSCRGKLSSFFLFFFSSSSLNNCLNKHGSIWSLGHRFQKRGQIWPLYGGCSGLRGLKMGHKTYKHMVSNLRSDLTSKAVVASFQRRLKPYKQQLNVFEVTDLKSEVTFILWGCFEAEVASKTKKSSLAISQNFCRRSIRSWPFKLTRKTLIHSVKFHFLIVIRSTAKMC